MMLLSLVINYLFHRLSKMRMIHLQVWLLVLVFAINTIVCPPVNVKKPEDEERGDDDVVCNSTISVCVCVCV